MKALWIILSDNGPPAITESWKAAEYWQKKGNTVVPFAAEQAAEEKRKMLLNLRELLDWIDDDDFPLYTIDSLKSAIVELSREMDPPATDQRVVPDSHEARAVDSGPASCRCSGTADSCPVA